MAANIVSKLLGGAAGTIVGQVGSIIDEFHLSAEEKQRLAIEMQSVMIKREAEIQATARAEMDAKEKIITAELTQGDTYTKRARPTIIYAGLGIIMLNYCLAPIVYAAFGAHLPELVLPSEFWLAWSGVVGIYAIGRSYEKAGGSNRVSSLITGTPVAATNATGSAVDAAVG